MGVRRGFKPEEIITEVRETKVLLSQVGWRQKTLTH